MHSTNLQQLLASNLGAMVSIDMLAMTANRVALYSFEFLVLDLGRRVASGIHFQYAFSFVCLSSVRAQGEPEECFPCNPIDRGFV